MGKPISRREMLVKTGTVVGAGVAAASGESAEAGSMERKSKNEPFRYCLNTSTLRGHKLPLVKELEIASKAGYSGVEPWIGEIEEYLKGPGTLKDLGKRIKDLGLTVESGIGFAEWIVDDDTRRAKGLEQAKRDMDLIAQIGGKRIAAPPAGATDQPNLNLLAAAQRYRALCELGDRMGITPMVEVWGFSQLLNRLGQAAFVAIESGHPNACILADIYHLYRGGSDYGGIRLLGKTAMHVLHVNDFPASPPREKLTDAHRVYPGDGVAPLDTIYRDLHKIGFRGALSLELFNRDYYKQDPLEVARTGIQKTRDSVQRALERTT